MNQMEAFKWEQKRLAATAKEREKDKGASKDRDLAEKRAKEKMKEDTREMEQRKEEETREKELCELEKLVHQQASRAGLDLPDLITGTGLFLTGYDSSVTPDRLRTSHEAPQVETASIQVSASEATNTPKESTLASTSSSAAMSSSRLNNASVLPSPNASETSFNETVWTNELTTASVTAMPASSTSTYSRAPAPRSDSSESIYAFIIRRLNALEGNSSLVARYIEEQSRAMGLTLGRVEKGWDEWKTDREGEDRGRWDQEVSFNHTTTSEV